MQNKEPVAVVLGGTNPHKELVNKLKSRGFFCVLVDYLENPPAKSVADLHIQESTLDKEAVLAIAKKHQASLVISACVDQANVTACYVAEKLGLPAPYSFQTSLNVTNKPLMKSKMVSGGIPTPKHIVVKRLPRNGILDMQYPLIVKPADSNSSKGVKRASNYHELTTNVNTALEISRTGEVVIEEYHKGMEVDVVAFIRENDAEILMVRHRIKVEEVGGVEMQYYRSIIPAPLPEHALIKIKDVLSKISRSFNLINTPVQVQAIITDDSVQVIEFAPRVGGGLSYRTVMLSTGFDILNATIDSYLGVKPCFDNFSPINEYFSEVNLYAFSGGFHRVLGLEKLKEQKVIEEFYVYKNPGARIGPEMSSNNRIGSFILRAPTVDEILNRYWYAINVIDIVDNENQSIFRKTLYKNPAITSYMG